MTTEIWLIQGYDDIGLKPLQTNKQINKNKKFKENIVLPLQPVKSGVLYWSVLI